MFGRATIRLGIGPYSSWFYFLSDYRPILFFCLSEFCRNGEDQTAKYRITIHYKRQSLLYNERLTGNHIRDPSKGSNKMTLSDLEAELDTDWMHPWIGFDWIAANGWCNFMLQMVQASLFRLLNVTRKLV